MSRFFFQDEHELLDEMLDVEGLPVELNDDVLRRILLCCGASTLWDVKNVDKRTHGLAAELLRDPRRFPRSYTSRGCQGAARRAAHRDLPARWTVPVMRGAGPVCCTVRPREDAAGGGGVCRLGVHASAAGLNGDRTRVERSSGATGWCTSLVDRWLSKDSFTCTLLIESLGGAVCIGVVGVNFGSNVGSTEATSPQHSRHAIVVDASGSLYSRGQKSQLALPRPRRPASAAPPSSARDRALLLRAGCRVRLVVNMTLREMRVELCASGDACGETGAEESGCLEVEGLPSEVAVAVCLGPCGGTSAVRLEGASTERSATHRYEGKTIVDDWDEDNYHGRDLRRRLHQNC